jgi:uncharacterized membrane protein
MVDLVMASQTISADRLALVLAIVCVVVASVSALLVNIGLARRIRSIAEQRSAADDASEAEESNPSNK